MSCLVVVYLIDDLLVGGVYETEQDSRWCERECEILQCKCCVCCVMLVLLLLL